MDYKIQISGLKPGRYEYEFSVGGELFREFGNTQISDGNLTAYVALDKGTGWMNVSCEVKGSVTVECDRCLEDLVIPVDFTADLAIKTAKIGEETEEADDFIIIDPSEGEVDLKQFIYDYICVNLPLKKVHGEGECNPAALKKLEEMRADETTVRDTDTYSPFGALGEMLANKDKNN